MAYFEEGDLREFENLTELRAELGEKFFEYYGQVMSGEGKLPKKVRALIALAVAHAQGCPYCIDAYTEASLQNGSNPEEMTEAVHVAAAMNAGISLVHSVQMKKKLKKLGAL